MSSVDLERFHTLGAPALSPDGRTAVVATSRPRLDTDSYRSELWAVPTDGSAPERRLTRGGRDSAPAYSPDGRLIAFLRAADGGRPQLHLMPADGGEPWRLTDLPQGAGAPVWSPDSRWLAFVSRVPDEGRYEGEPAKEAPRRITTFEYRFDGDGFTSDRPAHVFTVEAAEPGDDGSLPEPVQVTEGRFDHHGLDWSPRGDLLCFIAARHAHRDRVLADDVWVCAPDGSDLRKLTGTSEGVYAARFSPDGATVVYAGSDAGPDGRWCTTENAGVWAVPADGSADPVRLTDVERFTVARGTGITPVEEGVLFCNENRGAVDLLLVPYGGGESRVLMDGPRQAGTAACAGGVTVLPVGDGSSPGELVALGAEGERRLTSFATTREWIPMEEVDGTAPDGYPVHGWLLRPEGPGPHPVLLMIHGGPFAQYGWRVFDEAQVYAEAGYAVVMGNPRGSSGDGEAHGRAVRGDVGRVSAADLLALLDEALKRDGLDPERVGVLGGSHGGFMTTWMAAEHGDRFRAAISERAVNAIDSHYGSSDIGWVFAEQLYGDPSTWADQSPLERAHKIGIPMLIIHSEEDWRCPVEQAQRLFVALRSRRAEVEMLLFPGEGHEMSRSGLPSHRVARFEAILDWWKRYL
ncbi:S9 family peptidase [Nocardiopsis sp. RSe5-2]|uniref:S9 family peptidase n=1 Tax=Nocardiopsis endophytica TaxID=3018445 RepID=A0ABT4U793_9ACTN|nr:S9 family peptidase [Nocardiopsis endophytica]MDA2812814.1 S9 family peptidase [Nocardiopsis endophytica]